MRPALHERARSLGRLPGREREHAPPDRGGDPADEAGHVEHLLAYVPGQHANLVPLVSAPGLEHRHADRTRLRVLPGQVGARPEAEGADRRRLHDDVETELTHHRAAVEVALDTLYALALDADEVSAGDGHGAP